MPLLLLALYVGLFLFAYFLSDSMIFLPHPSSYKDSAEIIKITTAGGKKISAVYLPNPSAKFTLLVSHGNAEDLGDDNYWLDSLRHAGFSVFAYDYEGYGTSEGKPGEKACYEDVAAAYEFLAVDLKTPPDRIIIFGRSVGAGPAAYIAAKRPSAGSDPAKPVCFRVSRADSDSVAAVRQIPQLQIHPAHSQPGLDHAQPRGFRDSFLAWTEDCSIWPTSQSTHSGQRMPTTMIWIWPKATLRRSSHSRRPWAKQSLRLCRRCPTPKLP